LLVRDRQAGTTSTIAASKVPINVNFPERPSISADGRFVAFYTSSGQSGAFGPLMHIGLYDRVANTTEQISLGDAGQPSNFYDRLGRMSPDGAFVVFGSLASNLVPNDTNGAWDVFVRDRRPTGTGISFLGNPSGPYVGWASSATRPAAIAFDASRSTAPAGVTLIAKWDFGDGSPQLVVNDVATRVSHSYKAAGKYTVSLVVSDGATDSVRVRTYAEVFPAIPPDVTFVTPSCSIQAGVVQVSGIAADGYDSLLKTGKDLSQEAVSVAPIGALFMGTPIDISLELPNFTYRAAFEVPAGTPAGNYPFDVGGQRATLTLPCPPPSNHAPVADAGGPYQGSVGAPVSFTGVRSSDAEGAPLSYRWNFGDGTTGNGVQPQHAYATEGTYLATLVVNDGTDDSYSDPGSRSFALVTVHSAGCTLSGFFPPIEMSTSSSVIWNTAKAGSTIPLKFKCFAGAIEITDVALIQQPITAQSVACATGIEEDVQELTPTGGTLLRYDAAAGQFIYNWQTPKTPGACFKVIVQTKDGGSLTAFVKTK
jgi:PKD repeat protein